MDGVFAIINSDIVPAPALPITKSHDLNNAAKLSKYGSTFILLENLLVLVKVS